MRNVDPRVSRQSRVKITNSIKKNVFVKYIFLARSVIISERCKTLRKIANISDFLQKTTLRADEKSKYDLKETCKYKIGFLSPAAIDRLGNCWQETRERLCNGVKRPGDLG